MATILVGLKEFKSNMNAFTKKMKEKKVNLIVLNKNKPILEVRAIDSEDDFILDDVILEVAESRAQVAKGEVYSLQEARNILQV